MFGQYSMPSAKKTSVHLEHRKSQEELGASGGSQGGQGRTCREIVIQIHGSRSQAAVHWDLKNCDGLGHENIVRKKQQHENIFEGQ